MKRLDGNGIKDFLAKHNIHYQASPWKSGGEKLILEEFKGHTGSSVAIIIHPDGGIGLEDMHNSGQQYNIGDFIKHYEPDFYKDSDFDFTPPGASGSSTSSWNKHDSARMTDSQIVESILDGKQFIRYENTGYYLDQKIYVQDPGGKRVKQAILNSLDAGSRNAKNQKQIYELLLNDPRFEITDDQLHSFRIKGINYFDSEEGLIRAKDVKIEKPEFLYYPYFPKGKLILVGAYPGAGKTMLMSYFAARVTRGLPFFGSEINEAHRVLYFSNEDGIGDTLQLRFSQAKGDNERQTYFGGHISFEETFRIRNMIDQTGADIVIFDPLQSYASVSEMNNAVLVRQMFDRLELISIEKNITIIIVCHFNKNSKGDCITRIIGSTDIVGKCRSFIAVGNMPGNDNRKFFSHEKSNLARQGITQIFKIEPDNGLIIPDGTSTKHYDDFYQNKPALHDDKLETAKKLILENVDDAGLIYASDAYQLGKDEDISASTMKKARDELSMIASRTRLYQGRVIWKLPEPDSEDE